MIDESLKFDLQQNYRRYLKILDKYSDSQDNLKVARSSKIWMLGLICLVFALASDFFLGASAAFFSLYFYRIAKALIMARQIEESREQSEYWFSKKGFKFSSRILFLKEDRLLEVAIDPFDERVYSVKN